MVHLKICDLYLVTQGLDTQNRAAIVTDYISRIIASFSVCLCENRNFLIPCLLSGYISSAIKLALYIFFTQRGYSVWCFSKFAMGSCLLVRIMDSPSPKRMCAISALIFAKKIILVLSYYWRVEHFIFEVCKWSSIMLPTTIANLWMQDRKYQVLRVCNMDIQEKKGQEGLHLNKPNISMCSGE